MVYIFTLFFISLSFATQIFASEQPRQVRTIDLQIIAQHKFSDEKDRNSPICTYETSSFILDDEIDVGWGINPYSLMGQEPKKMDKEKFNNLIYVNNKKTRQMVDIRLFAQENADLIDYLQEKTHSLQSIPSVLLLANQEKHSISKDRTLIHNDMIGIERSYVNINEQQFEVTLYMSQRNLENVLWWLKDSQSDKTVESEQGNVEIKSHLTRDNKKLPSFISCIKKPFFCLASLLAIYALYKHFYK